MSRAESPLLLPGLTDGHGRTVRYLRLSVTDRCNLNCLYCRSKDVPFIPHKDILTYEEMLDLIALARSMGVGKVRMTGGEPFMRKDFLHFLERLGARAPGLDLRLTTNGTLLAGKIRTLKDIGVSCLNISLDTLDPGKFASLTGMDAFHLTRRAIDECLEEGMRVKVNAVALKGLNDVELADFLKLARDNPLDVRFIEFMPIGGGTRWREDYYWPADRILESAMELADLEPVEQSGQSNGPARLFTIKGGLGRIGLISPLSDHFCKSCNRLRVTSDGKLRTCLFSDQEYRLRPALRKLGPAAVRKIIELAGNRKPLGYEILRQVRQRAAVCGKAMSAIGG